MIDSLERSPLVLAVGMKDRLRAGTFLVVVLKNEGQARRECMKERLDEGGTCYLT